LELNVDTGNETGALKLYEKVGLKPESSWIQLHRQPLLTSPSSLQ
jgi:hypothetical protein